MPYVADQTLTLLGDTVIPAVLFSGAAVAAYLGMRQWQGKLLGINDPQSCVDVWTNLFFYGSTTTSATNSISLQSLPNKACAGAKGYSQCVTQDDYNQLYTCMKSSQSIGYKNAMDVFIAAGAPWCDPSDLGPTFMEMPAFQNTFPNFFGFMQAKCNNPCKGNKPGPGTCGTTTNPFPTHWDVGAGQLGFTPCMLYQNSAAGVGPDGSAVSLDACGCKGSDGGVVLPKSPTYANGTGSNGSGYVCAAQTYGSNGDDLAYFTNPHNWGPLVGACTLKPGWVSDLGGGNTGASVDPQPLNNWQPGVTTPGTTGSLGPESQTSAPVTNAFGTTNNIVYATNANYGKPSSTLQQYSGTIAQQTWLPAANQDMYIGTVGEKNTAAVSLNANQATAPTKSLYTSLTDYAADPSVYNGYNLSDTTGWKLLFGNTANSTIPADATLWTGPYQSDPTDPVVAGMTWKSNDQIVSYTDIGGFKYTTPVLNVREWGQPESSSVYGYSKYFNPSYTGGSPISVGAPGGLGSLAFLKHGQTGIGQFYGVQSGESVPGFTGVADYADVAPTTGPNKGIVPPLMAYSDLETYRTKTSRVIGYLFSGSLFQTMASYSPNMFSKAPPPTPPQQTCNVWHVGDPCPNGQICINRSGGDCQFYDADCVCGVPYI